MVRLNGDEFRMCAAAPPGQSGFVAADGETTEHYQDQLELYLNFECKDEHLTEDSVTDAAVSAVTITSTGTVDWSEQERGSHGLGFGWLIAIGVLVLVGITVVLIVDRRQN